MHAKFYTIIFSEIIRKDEAKFMRNEWMEVKMLTIEVFDNYRKR